MGKCDLLLFSTIYIYIHRHVFVFVLMAMYVCFHGMPVRGKARSVCAKVVWSVYIMIYTPLILCDKI